MANKNTDIEKRMPKKRKLSWYIPYIVVAVLCIILGMWGGYVISETADEEGNANIMIAFEQIDQYVTVEALINSFKEAVIEKKTYPKKGMAVGLLVGMIFFAYYATQKEKRFHRKGEEHGSARWGTDKEKEIIADVNDYYNNVILASDIFLVLDRKKRELNAMTDKERKANEKKEQEKAKAEKIRIDAIMNEINLLRGGNNADA